MQRTPTSRRSFLAGGIATTAAVAVAGCDGGSGQMIVPDSTLVGAEPSLTQREASEWQQLVGTAFTIHGETGNITARLAPLVESVPDTGRPLDLARQHPFTAIFEMDVNGAPAGGQTYRISHGKKGTFDLFLGHSSEVMGKAVMVAILN